MKLGKRKYSKRPKSEHIRILVTYHRSVVNWLERLKMTEIRTICSDFGHKFESESRTIGRSNVRFLDTLLS